MGEHVGGSLAVMERQRDLLAQILEREDVHCVFQSIVDLETGSVVGYEALARGPIGVLQRPDDLFAAARQQGRLADLDELCRRAAVRGAIAAGIYAPLTLFINVEPETVDVSALARLHKIAEAAPGQLQLVLEITERSLAARPAELLATVRQLRAAGWRVALDDVGAENLSLTFMPVLRPDIVKLDLSLVQHRPSPEIAEIMNAVNAYAERTGALILAEGIETPAQLAVARALGARLGQGWLFGQPGSGTDPHRKIGALQPLPAPAAIGASPFECLPSSHVLRESTKALLIEVSKHLERQAARQGSTCLVLASFQAADNFTPNTRRRYRELAARVGFVAAFGTGLGVAPVAGVRGADLPPGDPVRQEWDVVVIGPHFAAALLARDLDTSGPDLERRFEFALTYDRKSVEAAAESMMSRVVARDRPAMVRSAQPTELDRAGAADLGEFSPSLRVAHARPLEVWPQAREMSSSTDSLTGLPDLRALRGQLNALLQHARTADRGVALIHLRVDLHTEGRANGPDTVSDVLRTTADRLRRHLRRGDLVAYLGAEEFVVVLAGLEQADADVGGRHVANQLVAELAAPILIGSSRIDPEISVGVGAFPVDGSDVDRLLGAARSRAAVGKRFP